MTDREQAVRIWQLQDKTHSLTAEVESLECENESLIEQNEMLTERYDKLEGRLRELEAIASRMVGTSQHRTEYYDYIDHYHLHVK